MKAVDLIYAMNHVGSDFVEEAEFAKLEHTKAKKQHTGISRRFVAVLIAACLVLSLGIVAYATGFFGLVDYLRNRGLDTEVVESLTNDVSVDTVSYKNQYAEYTVLEAVVDEQSIYVSARVEPLDDSYFVVPESVFMDDPVAWLGIPGLENDRTPVKQYVESLGKTYVQVSLGCFLGDEIITTMKDFSYGEDGTLYLYTGNKKISDSQNITIKCVGSAVTEGMTVADKVEFEVQIDDKSSTESGMITDFDERIFDETGIKLNYISIEETEIGLYVTFEYENDGSITSLDGTWFKLCDAEGTEFKFLPGMGGSINDNGDGSFTETIGYQKPASLGSMTITIKDVWNGVSYGPYQMSVE